MVHKSVTADRIIAMCEEDSNEGVCIKCGSDQPGCEPDMEKGKCESCGALAVYGAENCILCGFVS